MHGDTLSLGKKRTRSHWEARTRAVNNFFFLLFFQSPNNFFFFFFFVKLCTIIKNEGAIRLSLLFIDLSVVWLLWFCHLHKRVLVHVILCFAWKFFFFCCSIFFFYTRYLKDASFRHGKINVILYSFSNIYFLFIFIDKMFDISLKSHFREITTFRDHSKFTYPSMQKKSIKKGIISIQNVSNTLYQDAHCFV